MRMPIKSNHFTHLRVLCQPKRGILCLFYVYYMFIVCLLYVYNNQYKYCSAVTESEVVLTARGILSPVS
jgi:hypothetical protein